VPLGRLQRLARPLSWIDVECRFATQRKGVEVASRWGRGDGGEMLGELDSLQEVEFHHIDRTLTTARR